MRGAWRGKEITIKLSEQFSSPPSRFQVWHQVQFGSLVIIFPEIEFCHMEKTRIHVPSFDSLFIGDAKMK